MKSQDDQHINSSNIHLKAEKTAKEQVVQIPAKSADLSPEEMRKIIRELRLQQIELERQIEELRVGQTQIKSEEAQREQRNFTDSLIETAQAIILVLDTQGCIVHFNPYMEQLVGYKLNEVKGLDWFETFVKLEDNKTILSVFSKTVDDFQTGKKVNPIITKDGRSVLVEWSNKTLKDENGSTVGILAI